MIIKEITIDVLNDFFTKDPKLSFLGLSDQSMDYLYHTGTIVISNGAMLYGVYDNDVLIGAVELEPWNEVCAVAHMYLSSDLHHTGTIRKIKDKMIEYTREYLTYTKILLYIPSSCEHVIMAAEAFGLTREALITNCIQWRQKTVDLVIYGLEIKR